MNVFEWLLIAHFAGDYLFQTEFEALNKMQNRFCNRALVSHCTKYTLCFIPVFWFYVMQPAWLLFIFGSHLFFDRRWFIMWWRKHINRNSDESIAKTSWLTITIDQIFHILVLTLIAYFF